MAFKQNCYEVITESGCWIWLKYIDSDGYGNFTHQNKPYKAHREFYKEYMGEIPAGFNVCHKCDVRSCVNPGHLFLGTHKDNIYDMVKKNRQQRGERNGKSKLTVDSVKAIKALLKTPGANMVRIAKMYAVKPPAINKIKAGKTWVHVND